VSDRVVNLRDFPPTIHLGRGGKFVKSRVLPPDVVRIDRATRWGNPYRIGRTDRRHGPHGEGITTFFDRDQSILAYRASRPALSAVEAGARRPSCTSA
jgi:Domain of unknown function (DUF4326)